MFRNLFQTIFGSFFRLSAKEQKQLEIAVEKERLVIINKERYERELIRKLIQEANYIASRDFLSEDTLFHNGKDRRKVGR